MITFEAKDVIEPTAFKEILLIDGVQSATVRKAEKGLVLVLRIGQEDRIFGQYRGGARYFKSVDGAASVLIQHGIYSFTAELTGWMPPSLIRSRTRKGGDSLDNS